MEKDISREELEAVLKMTEHNREELQKMWKKVEDLESEIRAANPAEAKSKRETSK